jgi:hypothetical protein
MPNRDVAHLYIYALGCIQLSAAKTVRSTSSVLSNLGRAERFGAAVWLAAENSMWRTDYPVLHVPRLAWR